MIRTLTACALILGLLASVGAATGLRADTTADCGRFFLKYNEQTRQMECVGGKRARPTTTLQNRSLGRELQSSLQRLQGVVGQAESLLRGEALTQEVERRVQALLQEARQRTREVLQKSRELEQEQRSRTQEVSAQQRQVTQAQVQLARQLEQKQEALTTQLQAEQRSRTQELLRGPTLAQ